VQHIRRRSTFGGATATGIAMPAGVAIVAPLPSRAAALLIPVAAFCLTVMSEATRIFSALEQGDLLAQLVARGAGHTGDGVGVGQWARLGASRTGVRGWEAGLTATAFPRRLGTAATAGSAGPLPITERVATAGRRIRGRRPRQFRPEARRA
jgi:hypothetical protein